MAKSKTRRGVKETPQICIVTVTGVDRVGIINNKTTSVRVIPVPGKKAGDIVHFGGLLGSAPVMKVPKTASAKFIARRGRIPSPIQALRN